MEFIVFLILFAVVSMLIIVINYYRRLFADKREEYRREELLNLKKYIEKEFIRLTEKDTIGSYTAFGIAVFVALIFSYMGGLYGRHYESYSFNSVLMPALLFILIPLAKENLKNEIEGNDFISKLFNHDILMFFGFSAAVISQIMTVYIIYHAISILWVIINVFIILGLLLYYLYKSEDKNGIISLLPGFIKGKKTEIEE
ncbi:MAG: hypothetical protein OEZ13_02865 [Spirochaetia bacterium]|nr:hypothetical protein [Spirochaetia bacterium]